MGKIRKIWLGGVSLLIAVVGRAESIQFKVEPDEAERDHSKRG